MSRQRINKFISSLANQVLGPNTTNQFSFELATNKIRRNNLENYLLLMLSKRPKILLVSEAPGYRGMKLTGVPFSSEHILSNHHFFTSSNLFNPKNGEKKELSATIVWNTLDELGVLPLMFPAFPFHPHKPECKESNRKPTKGELEKGEKFLRQLIEIFDIEKIIAVGKCAQSTLENMRIRAKYIRHPANGGSKEFREGLHDLIK